MYELLSFFGYIFELLLKSFVGKLDEFLSVCVVGIFLKFELLNSLGKVVTCMLWLSCFTVLSRCNQLPYPVKHYIQ